MIFQYDAREEELLNSCRENCSSLEPIRREFAGVMDAMEYFAVEYEGANGLGWVWKNGECHIHFVDNGDQRIEIGVLKRTPEEKARLRGVAGCSQLR